MLPSSMKSKLSISMEEQTIKQLDSILDEGLFRNKSHLIEYAITQFIRGKK